MNRVPAVSLYQARLEQSRCTRCGVEVPDGNDLCDEHAEDKRARQKRWLAEKRDRRRAAGLCIWCPESKPTKVPVNESSCLPCRIKRGRSPTPAAYGGKQARVEEVPTKRIGRARYRGQGKRGQQSRARLDAQDFRHAYAAMSAGESGLGMLDTPAVQSMGWSDRDEIEQESCSKIRQTIRYLEVVLARHPSRQEKRAPASERGGVLNGPVSVRSSRKK